MEVEFPSVSADSSQASVDYGRFVAFLEGENDRLVCLQQGTSSLLHVGPVTIRLLDPLGHDICVVYDSPCLPLISPNTREVTCIN